MKGKGKAKRKGKKDTGKLQKYMMTVNDFVKSKVGCDETEETEDGSGLRFVKKKNRKEMRKEKRKMKKAKIKNHYEGYKALKASNGDSEDVATLSDEQQTKKVNGKVKKDEPVSQQPKSTPVEAAAGEKAEKKGPKKPSKKEKKRNKLEESRKKALLEANIAEDREIKRLERSLGYNKRKNKKKLPQSFADDGLDYILGVLDAGSAASGIMHDSGDDMDIAKEKLRTLVDSESEMSGEEEEDQGDDSEEEGSELGRDGDLDTIKEEEDEIDEEEEDGMDEDDESEMDESGGIASEEENGKDEGVESGDSTLAGPKADTAVPSAGKYVPPHLRDTGDDKRRAELERLKRQVKGLVNRLSEANMASISGQLEELYMSSSRKDMNDTLTEILLAACVTPALMPDRLLMEHVLLVSILHHTVGLEVGANFLETVVRQFAELYKSPGEGKECDNLVAMVAHLYNFQVVHALLIFDILKMLVGAFTEKDIELVLFVLKNVGFALRKDDALALKELISEAQSKASGVGTKFQDENRVRFMLETMLALKNNDMRKIPGYDPEPVERLRKLQRTLIHQSSGGSDVKLRVSLENLLAAEQVGRWWIVGSSWSGVPMIGDQGNKTSKQTTAEGKFSAKVLDLARKQRMNTDIRRNIFCVIMTSEDYLDAFEKLIRLGLKDQQEREIVHVLMDCCLQEKSFNAFYAVLGEKFCEHDRRFQMTFQFSLWDKFKDLPSLSTSTFSNLVQLVTRFLQRKCLSLSILKVIEFGELDKPKVKFLRQVLTKLLKDTETEDLTNIFGRISGIPKLGMLREGLKLFISHFLLKNAQSQGPAEQADLLSERAEVATKAMEAKETKLKL
ncbi:nucleolar MIF4G domain-containing protein 1 isoform X1 [Salvelinus fontinalis]|uniref:nucleolar MIF4G domain-containing protein 1 isoform X1 n=2 Tax=Salvelinus fontinalis TaxID=8038 RepID=UPI002485D604|nr:nucleolar MIF4G domain-containing protein 1 isoform X1 [Salvelinus fontinalis]